MAKQPETRKSNARRGALQVYDALREDILWLRIQPGTALDEVGLADRFQVSRTPVREALLLLSGEGFVQFLPNRTTIVAPMLMNNVGDYLDMLLLLSRAAARSDAISGNADEFEICRLLNQCVAATGEGNHQAILKAENDFLRYLAGLTSNMFQIKYFDQVLDAGVRSKMLHYFPVVTGQELENANQDLARLADAVMQGEAELSDSIMKEIIQTEFAIVLRSLEPRFANDMVLTDHPVALESFL